VPLGAFVSLEQSAGPDRVMHYNGYPSAELNGGPAPGYSSGEAEALIAALADASLPNGMHAEWTELAYQKQLAGNAGLWVFPLSVLLVFLVLAALYESLTLPLVVILIVPMTLLSAIAGVWLAGGDNNIFTQIGLIVLVGLAAKNAILIVEFARTRELEGASTWDAIVDAARLRLRPILMTSIAFTAGVVPLVLAHGAGAEMRHAMGVAVFAGMIGVTLFGLVLTPVFYWLVQRLAAGKRARAERASIGDMNAAAAALIP
jgi:multidrug efflux pump